MDLFQHLNHMSWIERGGDSWVAWLLFFFFFYLISCVLYCCTAMCCPPVWCVSSYALLCTALSLRHVKYPSRDEGKDWKDPELIAIPPTTPPNSNPFLLLLPPPFLSECGKRFLSILKSESARHSRPSPPPIRKDGWTKGNGTFGKGGGDPFISFYHWFEVRKDSPFGFEEMTLECICFFGLVEVMWLRLFFFIPI
jgi:hypothetical protein